MENYSSNDSVNKNLGWRSFFWSATMLLALSGLAYVADYKLMWSILSLIATMIILIINIVACLPGKNNYSTKLKYLKNSISSMPIWCKYILDFLSLMILGKLIGFGDWMLWTFVILLTFVDVLYFYKINKKDKENESLI